MDLAEGDGNQGISNPPIPNLLEESAEEKPPLSQVDEALDAPTVVAEEGARGCEPAGDGVGGEDDAANPVEETEQSAEEEEKGKLMVGDATRKDERLVVRGEMDPTVEKEPEEEEEDAETLVEKAELLEMVAEEEVEPLVDSGAAEAFRPLIDAADDKVEPIDAVAEKEMEPMVDMLTEAGEPLIDASEGKESKPSVFTLDQEPVVEASKEEAAEPFADAAAKEEMDQVEEVKPLVDALEGEGSKPFVGVAGSKTLVKTSAKEEAGILVDDAAKEEMGLSEDAFVDVGMEGLLDAVVEDKEKPLVDAEEDDAQPFADAMPETESMVDAMVGKEPEPLVDITAGEESVAAVDGSAEEIEPLVDAMTDEQIEPPVDAKAKEGTEGLVDAMVGEEPESMLDATAGEEKTADASADEPESLVDTSAQEEKVVMVDTSAEDIEPLVDAITDEQIEPLMDAKVKEGAESLLDAMVGEEPQSLLDATGGEETMTTVDASAEGPEPLVDTSAQEETVAMDDASAEEILPLVDATSDEQIAPWVNFKAKEGTEGLVGATVKKSLEQLADTMAEEVEKPILDAALEKHEEMEPPLDVTAEKETKFLVDGTAKEGEKLLVDSAADDEHLMEATMEEETEPLVGVGVEETESLLDVTTKEAGEPSVVAIREEAAEPLVDGIAEDVGEPLLDAMAEEETEPPVVTTKRGGGKRKRGRPLKTQTPRTPTRRKVEEDVCFICFDGGNLVVCDRRGCPKVYHPSCVNRDEAFFRSKGKWNCGWHICSSCEKPSNYMCYTCTYSLCKGCIKGFGFVCVRGNKGLCQTCMSTVMLIETNYQTNEPTPGVDFDDKNGWEYLFKDYWLDLKGKLSLTLEELTKAKAPRKESNVSASNNESSDELYNANDDQVASSDSSSAHLKASSSSGKKLRKRSRSTTDGHQIKEAVRGEASYLEETDWASKELLEFVAHMKDGNRSFLSQFDVQALLLEYIKQNNLRDPRRKSQIICDARLQSLFGKPRVGHFEMLKLLESHFLVKEATQPVTDDSQGGVVDPDSSPVDAEGYSDTSTRMNLDKRRKTRRRTDDREPQTNIDDFAAIDVHNINLMYLRRNLMEELIDDIDGFSEKVVGSFVRIRISAAGQKQDMYRLVQVVGTRRAPEKYKTGRKVTDFVLEILNLDKTEVITIDIISNQEFTEEECKRLRQSIKCGLIDRLTVGDVQTKARALQAVRVNDWLENEKSRLGHLRDRASETGRRKELRECVEKLQSLNDPEERLRRLHEVPEIHADPHMDPDYESAEEGGESEDKRLEYNRPRGSSLRKSREANSLGKGGFSSSGIWSAEHRSSTSNLERMEGSFNRVESQRKELNNNLLVTKPGESESTLASLSTVINETEKMWHYQDPSGKVQGPFSMTQLRKWNTTGYFPKNLKIWKTSGKQEDSILLADAVNGKILKDLPPRELQHSLINQQKSATSSRVWESSTNTNTWSGQVGSNSPRTPASFSGNPYQLSSYGNAGRCTEGQDDRNTWNSNGPQGQTSNEGYERRPDWSSSGQQSVAEQKVQATYGSSKPWGNDPFNLHTPAPLATSMTWICSQATSSNSTATVQPLTSAPGNTPRGTDSHHSSSLTQGSSDTAPANPAAGWGINTLANITKQTEIGGNFSSHTSTSAQMSTFGKVAQIFGSASAGFALAFHPQISPLGAANILRSQLSYESLSGDKMSPVKNPVVVGGSSSVEGSVKNQFFTSDCPSPTPKSEHTVADALSSEYSQQTSQSKSDISAENLSSRYLMNNLQNMATFTSKCVLSDIQSTSVGELEKADSNASVPAIKQDQQDLGLISAAAGNAWEMTQASNHGRGLSGLEPVTSGNFQVPPERKSSEWSMPSPTPATAPSKPDIANNSATMNNQNNQLATYGSELLANSQWGSNTSNAPAQQSGTGLVSSTNDVQNSGWGVPPENSNTSIGPIQGTANIGSGTVIQGNPSQGWGMIAQGDMNLAWGIPAQSNANMNMSWANPAQVNTNANTAWTTKAQGNTNANMAWGALPQGNMIMNAGLSTNPQGVATLMATQGYPKTQAGWGTPTSQNTNQNPSWGTAQGNKNGNPAVGATQWNANSTWDPLNGNPNSWNSQQNQNGDGNSGQGDRGFQGNDPAHGGGRQPWNRSHSGGGSGSASGSGGLRHPPGGPRTGVCRFHESGHCKKGANCNYYHA